MSKNKEQRKVIHWTEYIARSRINRALHPKKEMLTDRGYYDKKAMDDEIVSVRYDIRYIVYWLNRYVLNKLGIDKSELIEIISSELQGGFSCMTDTLKPFDTSIPGLGRTNFAEFFQFLAEESKKGRFWMIFDLKDRCLFLTDNAEPGRFEIPTNQYIGANRLDGWRDTMEQYEQLQHLLKTEKVAPSFEYSRYRLDESFVHLQKTHYLLNGLFGTQCRASVSEGWELLRPAPTWEE